MALNNIVLSEWNCQPLLLPYPMLSTPATCYHIIFFQLVGKTVV